MFPLARSFVRSAFPGKRVALARDYLLPCTAALLLSDSSNRMEMQFRLQPFFTRLSFFPSSERNSKLFAKILTRFANQLETFSENEAIFNAVIRVGPIVLSAEYSA